MVGDEMKQKIINVLLKIAIVLTLLFVVFYGVLGWFSPEDITYLLPLVICVLLLTESSGPNRENPAMDQILLYGKRAVIALAILLCVSCFFLHGSMIKTVQFWVALLVIAFPYHILWSSFQK